MKSFRHSLFIMDRGTRCRLEFHKLLKTRTKRVTLPHSYGVCMPLGWNSLPVKLFSEFEPVTV